MQSESDEEDGYLRDKDLLAVVERDYLEVRDHVLAQIREIIAASQGGAAAAAAAAGGGGGLDGGGGGGGDSGGEFGMGEEGSLGLGLEASSLGIGGVGGSSIEPRVGFGGSIMLQNSINLLEEKYVKAHDKV